MDFLKRVVPPSLSGDLVLDTRDEIQGSSPRLLKIRRLSSLSSERTVDHPGENRLCGNLDDRCQHQQLGKVKMPCFQSVPKVFQERKVILTSDNLNIKNV